MSYHSKKQQQQPPVVGSFVDPRDKAQKEAQKREKKDLLNRAFDRLVGSQLSKISKAKNHTEEEDEVYRLELEQERNAASKRKVKVLTKEQQELASKGLSGQVVALMGKVEESNGEKKSKKKKKSKKRKKNSKRKYYSSSSSSDSDSSSESNEEEERRRRKRRKRRRKEEKRRKKQKRKAQSSSESE